MTTASRIPLAAAEEIIKTARQRMDMEHQQADDIKQGKKPLEIIYGDNWVDADLKGKVREFK